MAPKSGSSKSRPLSRGRPIRLTQHKLPATISAQRGRALIRKHHQLLKQQSRADSVGDVEQSRELQVQIDSLGGLEAYQAASKAGQLRSRGGDSSRILVQWLTTSENKLVRSAKQDIKAWRMLEVGALAADNACSTCGLFDVTRIDLNAQSPAILRQDFMQRPVPTTGAAGHKDRFDIVSLSLVLNFVPDARQRGEMLKRVSEFLIERPQAPTSSDLSGPFPALFLVLPAPCVTNSRYLDEDLLHEMLRYLGYTIHSRKVSSKLVYYLMRFSTVPTPLSRQPRKFPKVQRNPGKMRNNFAIILE